MAFRWRIASALAMAALLAVEPAHAARLHRPHHRRFLYPPPTLEIAPPSVPAPQEIEPFPQPPPVEPTPAPPNVGTELPGGMAITVTKILRSDRPEEARVAGLIDRPRQAAEQLAACWAPPVPPRGDTVEITIRFSFNGRGEVVGAPRATYVKGAPGISAQDVRESLFAAIRRCSPLRFTAGMAASAPGYPLSVRFVGRRADD